MERLRPRLEEYEWGEGMKRGVCSVWEHSGVTMDFGRIFAEYGGSLGAGVLLVWDNDGL